MKFVSQVSTAILFTLLVASCSGTDGGSVPLSATPSSMAQIDTNSAAPIARGVVDAVFTSGSFGDVVGDGSGGLPRYLLSAPTPETTAPCAVAGSVTVTGQVNDPTTLSAGVNCSAS